MSVVYSWTEARAAAGHAVVVAELGGCLQCGVDRTGVPTFQVTTWRDGATGAMEEPACGAHYQPYGPVELGFVTNLWRRPALDCLLGTVERATHRIYAARRTLLDEAGGRWSDDFRRRLPRASARRDLVGAGMALRFLPELRACGCRVTAYAVGHSGQLLTFALGVLARFDRHRQTR